MSFELPPIVKAAQRLQADIELAVRVWPRYHKYAHGLVLREKAMLVTELANRAWRDRPQQARLVHELVWAVDALKLSLQLGVQIKAFASFRQFEALARLASDLGKQCGGWQKQQQSKRQNEPAAQAPAQRPQILSTPAAPMQHGAQG